MNNGHYMSNFRFTAVMYLQKGLHSHVLVALVFVNLLVDDVEATLMFCHFENHFTLYI